MKSATRLFVSIMGAWMGLAGIEHGIGEILQGNIYTPEIMIRSWPDSSFFQNLSGEPAITIVPNLLFTGILAVFFSSLFIYWSIFKTHLKHGGLGLMLISILMLLFGGGIFPPILGFLIGVSAYQINTTSLKPPASALNRILGKRWGWIFVICCIFWLMLFPGVAILGYFFGIEHVGLIVFIMIAAFCLLPLTYLSCVQADRLRLNL